MWRSTTQTGGVYKIPVTPKCIRAIYLGLAMSGDDKQKITAVVAQQFPDAKVWCAFKRHGDLALDFHRHPV
jgi:hypothetical protein